MKNTLLLSLSIILSIVLCSCYDQSSHEQQKYVLDYSSILSVNEGIRECVKQKDISIIKRLHEYASNSLITKYSESESKKLEELFLKSPIFLKTDYDTVGNMMFSSTYYEAEDGFYVIQSIIFPAETSDFFYLSYYSIASLNDVCNSDQEIMYCPEGIEMGNITWTRNYAMNAFASGVIEIQNNTDIDVDYVKFRIKITNKNTQAVVFNQTIEDSTRIYSGDLVSIKIPSMYGYSFGNGVTRQALNFEATLIEALPKPLCKACVDLEKLKSEFNANTDI